MLYLVAVILLIGLCLAFPKSKFVLLLGFILIFIISTHFQAGNDITNLQGSFSGENINSETEERSLLFYSGLLYLNSLGFSFYEVRCISFLIWASAIFLVIVKFSNYSSYVLGCCILFPILTYASQMRNGLSVGFLYFAILNLFTYKKRILCIISYVILLVVAGLFHYLGFIYLIGLLAVSSVSNRLLRKYVTIICISIFVLYESGFLKYCISFISSYYANQYFSATSPSNLVNCVFLISGILINYKFSTYALKIIVNHRKSYTSRQLEFSKFVVRLNLISFVFLPLLLISGSYYRIYQNLFILSVIVLGNASKTYITKNGNQGYLFRVVYFCFFICVSAFYIHWQGEFFSFFNSIRI